MRNGFGKVIVMAASLALIGAMLAVPAGAHGSGVVKSCIQGTSCISNSANNAVFAVCSPLSATTTCNPGRDVTIELASFGASKTVHVWFLNGEVDNPNATDCSQAVGVLGRTHLGDVTTSASGTGSMNTHLPPAGGTPGTWSYGSNWICATTAPHSGGIGTIGDQLFTIYPV